VIARAADRPHHESVGEQESTPVKRRKRTNETRDLDIVTDSRRGFRAIRHYAARAKFKTGTNAEVDEEEQEEQKVDDTGGCPKNFTVEVVSI
jgi:hypothetical protein